MENENQILSSKTVKNSGVIENVGSEIHISNLKIKKFRRASHFISKVYIKALGPIQNVRSELRILVSKNKKNVLTSHFTHYYISFLLSSALNKYYWFVYLLKSYY